MEITKDTVDIKNVTLFNEISKADEWWTKLHTLYKMNEVRVPFILKVAKEFRYSSTYNETQPLAGMKILDVGCGVGFVSEAMVKLGADVTGIDAGGEVIRVANTHAVNNPEIDNNKINYEHSTIEDFCIRNKNKYDMVVASEIIEHVLNQSLFLKCCVETLKPGCPIIVTTINRTWHSKLKAIIFMEYIINVIPKGAHEWNKFVTPQELKNMYELCNCELKEVQGCDFAYMQGKWENTSYSSVFYMTYGVKSINK